MLRTLTIALFVVFGALRAEAANVCPYISFGWGQQWPTGDIQSASYDQVAQILYIIFRNQKPQAFWNVPVGAIQSFSNTRDPAATYRTSVLPSYPMILLDEKTNCPILQEAGGYICTNYAGRCTLTVTHTILINELTPAPILLQNGTDIWLD